MEAEQYDFGVELHIDWTFKCSLRQPDSNMALLEAKELMLINLQSRVQQALEQKTYELGGLVDWCRVQRIKDKPARGRPKKR